MNQGHNFNFGGPVGPPAAPCPQIRTFIVWPNVWASTVSDLLAYICFFGQHKKKTVVKS